MSDPTTAPVAGPLRIGKLEDFARVRSFFTSADFDEASACSVLGIKDMSELYKVDWTQIEMDRIPGPLRWSLGVFLQGGTVSEADLRLVCGDDTFAAFQALGLIQAVPHDPATIISTVWLCPVHGFLTASDRTGYLDGQLPSAPQDVVFPAVYPGTIQFLRLLPDARGGEALDFCGGSGIGALVLARTARLALTTDITERSTFFAAFNAKLNGANIESLCGNLYEPVKDRQFDLITAHPPFVPAAGRTMIFRDAGETGEDIIRGTIEGLPAHLRVGGTCMIRCAARDTDVPFEQRVRGWLGSSAEEFDIVFGMEKTSTPEEVVDSVRERLLQAGPNEPQLLLDRLRALGTQQYVHGVLLIRRSAEPVRDQPLRIRMLAPATPADFDRLLDWRRFSRTAQFRDWIAKAKPCPAPDAQLSVRYTVGGNEWVPAHYIFLIEAAFQGQLHLDMSVAPALLRLNGQRTIREVFESARADGIFPSGSTLDVFIDLMRLMIERGYLALEFPR